MLIPKKTRRAILQNLFNEGVVVAKKDFVNPKHPEIEARNLYVIKLMQSLKSKGYVTETFNWQYFYWYLTNEGIEHLRDYLHLPEEIVPSTLKKPRTTTQRPTGPTRVPEGRGKPTGQTEEKKTGPSPDFKPEFKGGYGRGGARRELS
jgi:small subunit ribosomal protein S10e